jgi:hypothetical protein
MSWPGVPHSAGPSQCADLRLRSQRWHSLYHALLLSISCLTCDFTFLTSLLLLAYLHLFLPYYYLKPSMHSFSTGDSLHPLSHEAVDYKRGQASTERIQQSRPLRSTSMLARRAGTCAGGSSSAVNHRREGHRRPLLWQQPASWHSPHPELGTAPPHTRLTHARQPGDHAWRVRVLPRLRHRLGARVELHPHLAVHLQVAVEGAAPACGGQRSTAQHSGMGSGKR